MPQALVQKRLTALLSAVLLALVPLPALGAAPLGLPEGWTLRDAPTAPDGKPRWAYRTPTDRKGTYLHGASGQIEVASDWEEMAKRHGCVAGTGANAGWSPLPGREYWYYEADGEGLLLLRTHEFALDRKCKDVIRTTDTVERVLIGKNGFTRFTPGGPGWIAETHHFAAYRYAPGNDVMIGNGWPPPAYFAVRKRKLGDSNVGQKIGKAQTHCVGHSSPPDAGGVLCWLAGNGPGKGILTHDMELIAGGPNIYHDASEIEDGVMLDGRLFEWDRPLTPP